MLQRRNMGRAGPEVVKLLSGLKIYPGATECLRTIHDMDVLDKHYSLLGSVSKTQPGLFTEGTFKIYLDFHLIFHGLPPRVAYLNGHDVPSVLERLAEQVASTVEAFASLSGH